MAGRKTQPRMLNEVMDAIADLKESQGSTMRQILKHVGSHTGNKRSSKVSSQPVLKALKQGIEMGLIKRNKGKFKLGMDSKDFAVYKIFQKKQLSSKALVDRSGRRRRRRRTSRRRSGRRRNALFGDDLTDAESYLSSGGELYDIIISIS